MQMEDDFNNDMQHEVQAEEEVAVVNKKAPKNEAVRAAPPKKNKTQDKKEDAAESFKPKDLDNQQKKQENNQKKGGDDDWDNEDNSSPDKHDEQKMEVIDNYEDDWDISDTDFKDNNAAAQAKKNTLATDNKTKAEKSNNLFDSKVQEIPSLLEEKAKPQIDFFGTGMDDQKSDQDGYNMFNGNDFADLENDFEQ